jgi:hypothetical protein
MRVGRLSHGPGNPTPKPDVFVTRASRIAQRIYAATGMVSCHFGSISRAVASWVSFGIPRRLRAGGVDERVIRQ